MGELGLHCLLPVLPSPPRPCWTGARAEHASLAALLALSGHTAPPSPRISPTPPPRLSLQAEEIAVVKGDAEADLAQAKPALDAALAALNSITPKVGSFCFGRGGACSGLLRPMLGRV